MQPMSILNNKEKKMALPYRSIGGSSINILQSFKYMEN